MKNKNLIYIFSAIFIIWGAYFVLAVPPIVTMVSPADNAWNTTTGTNIQFKFQCGSNWSLGTVYWNATLWLDNKRNYTHANNTGIIQNDTTVNITVGSIAEGGTHTWKIQCINGSTISGGEAVIAIGQINSTTRTFGIDTVEPSVALNIPGNNTWNLSSSVDFAFTVTEANPAECNLTINGANNKTNSSGITSGSRYTYAATTLSDGTYIWNVLCYDQARQTNFSWGNFTLKLDGTNPSGLITMPKITNINVQNPIKISCTGVDHTGGAGIKSSITLKVTKPSKKVLEYTVDSGEEKILRNLDTGEAGEYYVDCIVYDKVNKTYNTEQKSFTTYYRAGKAAAPEVTPGEEITPGEEEAEGIPTEGGAPTEGGEAPSKAWIWVVIGVVVIGIIYFVLKKKR